MVRVEMLGTAFNIDSDQPEHYLRRILDYYADRVERIAGSIDTADPVKKAILAALLVTDELFQERAGSGSGEESGEAERITSRILDTLAASLE